MSVGAQILQRQRTRIVVCSIMENENRCVESSKREVDYREEGRLFVLVVFEQVMYISRNINENRPGISTWPEINRGGRCWVRTSDPCRVKAVLSR
jgi:hypothetical protein